VKVETSLSHLLIVGLQNASSLDLGLGIVFDVSVGRPGSLDALDNGDGRGIVLSNFTEDNVLAIQPRGLDSGDKELRAVGVGSSIGHGQQVWAGVLSCEVLVGKLLAVDGLATSAVATGKVSTLKHEFGDHAVERGSSITETLFAGAESLEVGGGLGNNVIVELEVDAAILLADLAGGPAVLEDGALPGHIEIDAAHVVCG